MRLPFSSLLLLLLLLLSSSSSFSPYYPRVARDGGEAPLDSDPFNPSETEDPFEPLGPTMEPFSPSSPSPFDASSSSSPPPAAFAPAFTPSTSTHFNEEGALPSPTQGGSASKDYEEEAASQLFLRIYGSATGMVIPRYYMKPVRNFVCVGDSLTKGYTRHGALYYPYSIRLEDLLSYYTKITPQIDNFGLVGQRVEKMVTRLPNYFSKRYDWVIILGGTNNVIAGTPANVVASMIFQLHAIAHNHGARTVAITIPEMASERFFPDMTARRNYINEGIRQYARSHSSNTVLVDLARYLPQNSLSPRDQRIYWDDGVHMTPTGYNYLGYLIYAAIASIV